MFPTRIHITLHSAPPRNNYYVLFIYLQRSSFMYLWDNYEKIETWFIFAITEKCQMLRRKNLIIIKSIIVGKWNHLFMKNYFRKKKLLLWIYARRLSGHLWFNGRQKLPVTGLNWISWREALPLQVFQSCPWRS